MQPIQIYELVTGEDRFFSPFCWATRLAVTHKNIPVKTVPWKFRQQARISFTGQNLVPVIVDGNKDGKWVNDSWAIAEYLEDTYPERKSLFGGTEGSGMATALFVQNWFIGGPLDYLMKIVVLDEMKAQSTDLQPWFKETREAMFGPLHEDGEQQGYQDMTREELVTALHVERQKNEVEQQKNAALRGRTDQTVQEVVRRHIPADGENFVLAVDMHKEIGDLLETTGRYDATGASWEKEVIKELLKAGMRKREFFVQGSQFFFSKRIA